MTDVLVDCMATARRVLSGPSAVYTLTAHEAVALAACTVRESTGEMPALPIVQQLAGPVISASLVAVLAQAIAAHTTLLEADDIDTFHASEDAFWGVFHTLKIKFEKEFPNGSA